MHLPVAPLFRSDHDSVRARLSRMEGDVMGIQAGQAKPLVLIVDDETHNRALLDIMLSSEGYELITAASGEEALSVVEQRKPDIILLDIMMPELNGFQVITMLKADPATRDIPIILLSALDDLGAIERGLQVGAADFLTKPIQHIELRARVRKLLR